jgi:hypothetical protein
MGQYSQGNVRVVTSDATVWGIWELRLTTTDTYTATSTTWGVDGAGTAISWDAANKILKLYRTSGALPQVGDTIEQTTAVTGTIASFESAEVDFSSNVSVGDSFYAYDGVKYVLGGSITADTFELASNFAGTGDDYSVYAIHSGRTTRRGYPKLGPGDNFPLPALGEFSDMVDTDHGIAGYYGTSGSGTKDIDWTEGEVHAFAATGNTTFTFTAPSGAAARLTLLISTDGDYTLTWPSSSVVKWGGGTALTGPTTSGVDRVDLLYISNSSPPYWAHIVDTDYKAET